MEGNESPLTPFLASLAADGIYLTLRDYERVHLALQTSGPWTLIRLRDTLLALLAKDEEQYALLRRRFHEFFAAELAVEAEIAALDTQQVLTDLRHLAAQRPVIDKPKSARINLTPLIFSQRIAPPKVKLGFWTAWFVLLVVGLGMVSYLLFFPGAPEPAEVLPPPTQVAELVVTPTALPAAQSRKRLYTDVPYVADIRYELLESFPLWQRYAGIAVFFFFAALLYGLYLWRSHKIPEDEAPVYNPDGPRHFALGSIGGEPAPRLNDVTLNELADSMGYFQSSEGGHRLNVVASIQTTMRKGGTPALEFYRRHQLRSLLILEDAFAEALTWNPLARELAEGMARLGVPITYGRFYGSPAQFKTPDGALHRLEDLEEQRQGYLLLLFTDGKNLQREEQRFVLEELTHWPMIAWLDLREPRAWDETAALPVHYGIPIYHATPDGVLQAVRSFLTEQWGANGYGRNGNRWQGLPSQAGSRIDAHVEQVLGDALLWAQDCAMLQPVTPGLADGLRLAFHPDLPAERIERLYALPGTQVNISGLRFSHEVLRVLRSGFLARRSDTEQEAVLRFLLREIGKAEPSAEDSPAHLAWEAVHERVRLEVEQDAALARLAQLAKTSVGPAISASLENFGFREEADQKIPLRLKPNNQYAWQRLARIADSFNIPKLEAYPIGWGHQLTVSMLVVLFISFIGISVRHLLWPPPSYENLEIMGSAATLNETYVQLNVKVGERWSPQKVGKIQTLDSLPLLTTNVYSLTLYGDAYRSVDEIIPKHHYRMIICLKTFNETETCPKEILPESTTQDEDAAEAENKAKLSVDCRIEPPGIGLTVERCPVSNAQFTANDSDEIILDSWRKKLGSGVPNQRMMSIGLEVSLSRQDHPALRRLRSKLLETSSVDVIYRIYPDSYGNWHTDEIIQFIYDDLGPMIEQSQLIWWTAGPIPTIMPIEEQLSPFDRIFKLGDGTNPSWIESLVNVLASGQGQVITEKDILQTLGRDAPDEDNASIVLIRSSNADEIAMVTPMLTETSGPTMTLMPQSCVPAPAIGWVAYQIERGDTLSSIALRTGTTVASLIKVNCLSADLIRVGATLFVPATPIDILGPPGTQRRDIIATLAAQATLTVQPTDTVGPTNTLLPIPPMSTTTSTPTLLPIIVPAEATPTSELTITLVSTVTPVRNVGLSGGGGSENCNAVIANLSQAIETCRELNVGWVCYASANAQVSPVEYRFFKVGDRRPLEVLDRIDILDENGVVVMNLAFEGESAPVKAIVFGQVSLAANDLANSGVFVINETNGDYLCSATPPGMVVRTEAGAARVVTVNGVDIELR